MSFAEFLRTSTDGIIMPWYQKADTRGTQGGKILKLFFIGRKILKYRSDFYNWHLSIALKN